MKPLQKLSCQTVLHLPIFHSAKYLWKLDLRSKFVRKHSLRQVIYWNIFWYDTEMVGDVGILPPLPKFQHYPVVLNFSIEVNDDLNSVTACFWKKGKYAEINEDLERISWESMFEA